MRGITGAILVTSLFTCESKLGESSKMILLPFTLVWVLASWDCQWLHAGYMSSSRSSDTTFTRLFLYFAKSNSSPTLIDLIFPLILSIHVIPYLIYSRDPLSYLTHISSRSFSHTLYLSLKCAGYFYDVTIGTKGDNCLLVRRRTVFLGQLKGHLGADQLVGQHLDLLLDGHESTWNRNGDSYLVLLYLQLLP